MNIADKIKEYIQKKYDAKVIVLHGSRATGHATDKSDWDLFVFSDKEDLIEGKFVGEDWEDEQLDVNLYSFPIKENLVQNFMSLLTTAKVLFDTEEVGEKAIKKAKDIRDTVMISSPEKIAAYRSSLKRVLNRVDSRGSDAILLNLYLADFIERAINSWFVILQKTSSIPFYRGLPMIEAKDKEFYELIMICLEGKNKGERVTAAQKLMEKLL